MGVMKGKREENYTVYRYNKKNQKKIKFF